MRQYTRKITWMRSVTCVAILSVLSASGVSPAATPTTKQVVTGPVAVYWMNSATSSGMTLGSSGGGRPTMSAIMGMMKGGNTASHSLRMELGSSQTASADAAADHLPPDALELGKDLPLYYKRPVTQKPVETHDEPATHDYEAPKGKILIFWGCGEHAGPNQPLVIDLSTLTESNARMAQMAKLMTPIALDNVRPPSPENWKSYGEWPNAKSSKGLTGSSSLVGAHTIKGNYSPQIDFTLSPSQDFMDPIALTGNVKDNAGAVILSWQPITRAKGIVATVIGGSRDGTVVMWTSAQIQTGWMAGAPEYLTPNDIDRLLDKKALLPGNTTTCTVPAEVSSATQGGMFNLTAYGDETNLSYPPRPADPKVAWNIQWETKIRYRTSTGGILGQAMPGMDAQDDTTGSSSGTNGQGDKKKKKGFGLGDLIKQGAALIPGT